MLNRTLLSGALGFVVLVGVLIAVFRDVARFGIGGHPAGTALSLAGNTVVAWTLMGLAMAGPMRPPGRPTDSTSVAVIRR